MYSDLKYLEVPLPEDIEKVKCYGDFPMALRMIDARLEKDIPAVLKKKLELEKEIIRRIPENYPYSREDALKMLHESMRDFKDEELEKFREDNAVEWIYIDGKPRFHRLFLDNLYKTRAYLAERNLHRSEEDDRSANFRLLDEAIASVKKNGTLNYQFHMQSTMKIADAAQEEGKEILVHLPIPVEYAQVKNFRLLGTSPEPFLIAPPEYPQRTVCFKTTYRKGMEFRIEYEYETHMRYTELDPEKVQDDQPTFYTEELPPHIHFTPYLKALTKEVVGGEQNPLLKARKIYDFITSHVMYSFVRSYFTIEDLTSYVATGLKGDCGLQALLFINMCRIAGVPARWQSGLYVTPMHVGNHDWAQFYISPYGWLFADCSFGGTAFRNKAAERRDYYFGHLDPFRLPAASEFQHEFRVPSGTVRSDPYDNQDGEASYPDRNLLRGEFITEHKLLDYRVF
jgi:hypothetical protein